MAISTMTLHTMFPTQVYVSHLRQAGWLRFNRELLRECQQVREYDVAGQKWCKKNYPGGYTSYGSLCHMQKMSSTFATLEQKINRHVKAYVRALEYDMTGRELTMTDCWINIMPQHVVHGLHIHPTSMISGTYYVQTPKGCSGLKFEDPRLDSFMATPPRKADCRPENKPWITVPAQAGNVALFESWIRHEVPINQRRAERISISFNYSWF